MTETEGVQGHVPRETLLRYIENQPGVSFVTLQRVLGLNQSTLRYHLEFLERKKQVHVKLNKGQRCYFPGECQKDESHSGLTPDQARVLRAITDRSGISKKELATILRMEPSSISSSIDALKERKLIWKVKGGRDTGYEIITREKLKQEILKLLVSKFLKKEIDLKTYERLKAEMERPE